MAVWVPPVGSDKEHVAYTHGAAGGLVANLRSQILANGLPGVAAFCRGVRNLAISDLGDTQEITQEAFRASASFAGAKLTVSSVSTASSPYVHACRPPVNRRKGVVLLLSQHSAWNHGLACSSFVLLI